MCCLVRMLLFIDNRAVVAEWLRRLTRNQFPSGSVGSNPTDCGNILILLSPEASIGGPMQHADLIQHRWFSGRMLACHAGGPGSIPGRCKSFFLLLHSANLSTSSARVQGILLGVLGLKFKKKKFWRRGVSIPVPLTC